jgi:hypothetical protein
VALEQSGIYSEPTNGRRYCFTIMDFKVQYNLYEHTIRKAVLETTGAERWRADDLVQPAGDVRPKIHRAIEGAEFIVADISTLSPNVLYEVGYAAGKSRPLILLAQDTLKDSKIPFDFRGIEIIRYADTRAGAASLDSNLRRSLGALDSSILRRQSFVLPDRPDRSYILANPKLPTQDSRFSRHPAETRTYGDYLGVSGIFRAFASFYGENFAPELLSAAHASDALVGDDANLYLIGSGKVNRFTEMFLAELQGGQRPNWQFGRAFGEEKLADYKCELRGELRGAPFSRSDQDGGEDWGVIVRGPHPRVASRMVLIMAGAGSLGTGAACLAGTNSELVRDIRRLINDDGAFIDRRRLIWSLVRAQAGRDGHIDASNVTIEAAAVFPSSSLPVTR